MSPGLSAWFEKNVSVKLNGIVSRNSGTIPVEGERNASPKTEDGKIPHETQAGSRRPFDTSYKQLLKVR